MNELLHTCEKKIKSFEDVLRKKGKEIISLEEKLTDKKQQLNLTISNYTGSDYIKMRADTILNIWSFSIGSWEGFGVVLLVYSTLFSLFYASI